MFKQLKDTSYIRRSSMNYIFEFENGTFDTWQGLAASMNFTFNASAGVDHFIDGDPYALRYGIGTTVVMSIGYGFICIVGLLGNLVVILTVCQNRRMNDHTNFFLANLAVADLLVNVLCVPFTLAANIFPAWTLGPFCCKVVAYFQGVSVCASVNTLMAISIERCRSISRPFKASMTTRQYRISVSFVWVFSLFINLPWLYVFTLESMGNGSSLQICVELWSSQTSENMYFIGANLILCYLGPLLVISICYIVIWFRVYNRHVPGTQEQHLQRTIKNRNKATGMILVVVVSFAIMWLPLYIIFCIIKLTGTSNHDDQSVHDIYKVLVPLAQWLGASNSAINPIVYSFMNSSFRTYVKEYFCRCCLPKSPTIVGGSQKRLLFRHNTGSNGFFDHNIVDKVTTLSVIPSSDLVSAV